MEDELRAFQQELADSIAAINQWQDDLVAIAGRTSPEFATYLAFKGTSHAAISRVSELASNGSMCQAAFAFWKLRGAYGI